MKPFILNFAEEPDVFEYDHSLVEYSSKHNLTVLRNTEIPAICSITMVTETNTRKLKDPSDDNQRQIAELKYLMGTETATKTVAEATDPDISHSSLRELMVTETFSKSKLDPSDADR